MMAGDPWSRCRALEAVPGRGGVGIAGPRAWSLSSSVSSGAEFGGSVRQRASEVGVLRRDQLLGTGKFPLMTRVTTTLGDCGSVIPCCLGPRVNR